jgi:hypothetical protein
LHAEIIPKDCTDPRFAGSNPTEGDGFLRVINIGSTPSFGREVKPSATCRKIYSMLKNPSIHERDIS